MQSTMGSMYMGQALLNGSEGKQLLTCGWREYWTMPELNCTPQNSSVAKTERNVADVGADLASAPDRMNVVTSSRPLTETSGKVTMSFAKLDMTTLQNLGWSSALIFPPVKHNGQQVPMASTDGKEPCSLPNTCELVDLKDNTNADPTFSHITKAEFRRLSRQLQESNNYSRKSRLGFLKTSEKLYQLTPAVSPDPATQALHLQLQASRTPFQSKLWRPLSQNDLCSSPLAKDRPLRKRPTTACSSKPVHGPAATAPSERPRSVPVHGGRTPPSTFITEAGYAPRPPSTPRPSTPLVTPGDFDTLTPRVLSELLGDDPWPLSSMAYGDKIWERVGSKQSSKEVPRPINLDISTSGFGSEGGEDDEEDDNDYNDEDESSESDSGGFEPSLEQARRNMFTAQSVFRLRPERLDAIYTPEDKRDMRRFDFDAGNVDTPPYLFTCPLPLPFSELNLQLCAREDRDWRKQLSLPLPESVATQNTCVILDRLVEMEKAQIVTKEWEARKLRKQSRRQQSSGSSSRSASARMRDKRCCGLCLQVACVGNCPEKWLATDGRCDKCRELLCTGACQNTRYEQHMRQILGTSLGVGDKSPATFAPRPPSRGCHLCKERNNAKIINSNNLLLGRPKSCNATFSRGKASNRPRDLRPTSAFDLSASLLKDFERLGIEPQQPLPQPKSLSSRTHSRNGLLPGKSAKSNRKNSISESRYKRKRFKANCTKTVS